MGVILADSRPIQTVHAIPSDGIPRLGVTPKVGVNRQAKQQFGDGTNELRYLRGTANAGDPLVAANQLLAGFPDTTMLLADQPYVFAPGEPITRLSICAFGDALGSATAGYPVDEAGTEAEVQARMVEFTFELEENVKAAIVTVSQFYSAAAAVATATNFVMVQVEGLSYA